MKDKIKVLWFEVGEPSQYTGNGTVLGGWQDSLERLVKQCDNISLYVAFESHRYTETKNVDGVWLKDLQSKMESTTSESVSSKRFSQLFYEPIQT